MLFRSADVDIEVVPGVSAVTAFTTALGVEIASGASLTLHEAARGAAPTGPDRMILFKVTDVPTTHEQLVDAGYDVVYGRRLCMEQGETVVTDDPRTLDERDYYTLAYAEKRGIDSEPATAAFEVTESEPQRESRSDSAPGPRAETDGRARSAPESRSGDRSPSETMSMERAEGEACGDVAPGGSPR